MDEKEDERKRRLMRLALKEAEKALEAKEVPVGCVLVRSRTSSTASGEDGARRVEASDAAEEEEIISSGSNETNESFNATKHAEIVGQFTCEAKHCVLFAPVRLVRVVMSLLSYSVKQTFSRETDGT